MASHSFIHYYHEYKHKVHSYLYYRVGGDTGLAEDLTSDVFLKGFEKFDQYDSQYAFSTWIFTIARNTLTDHWRREGRMDIAEVDDVADYAGTESPEEHWQKDLDKPYQMELIHQALDTLPDFQKDCIIMKYLDDKTTKEIADITQTNESNVRQALSRGFKKIRPMLSPLLALLTFVISLWR